MAMKDSVIAIGNFDGLHLGHQHLLEIARAQAEKHGYTFSMLSFTPHPRQVFQPDAPNFLLTPYPMKDHVIDALVAPDFNITLEFDHNLQQVSADNFITNTLLGAFNAKIIVVGRDFCFGHKRSGNIETLRARPEFETIAVDLIEIGGQTVTSSRIRDHLRQGQIHQANALLGWDWFIEGEVVKGDQRGRELGYPTANMHFGDGLVPAYGIYAVKVMIDGEDRWRHGAANIGIRPMFESKVPLLETYIFDFDGDLYGKTLCIQPVQKIRDEMKFDSLDDLKTQMAQDCAIARGILTGV